jgi:5-methylcytosine-specific restriction protein B
VALAELTDPEAIRQAMAEADRMGEKQFRDKYGFLPSRRFRIAHEGKTYPSKPILAAAHGIQFPSQGPLRPRDFSGGPETTSKARKLGFTIVDERSGPDTSDELGLALQRFARLFGETRQTKLSGEHPAVAALKTCATEIQSLLPSALRSALVKPSVGQGNWAAVPWIAVLDPSETTTTRRGTYPVLLFSEDLQAVEVTIAQGVTELRQRLGRKGALAELDRRAQLLRADLKALVDAGFLADTAYSLGTSSLGRDYVASTVVHRRFAIESLPESDISEAIEQALFAYAELLTSGVIGRAHGPDADGAMAEGSVLVVYVGQRANVNFESGGRDGWWGWKDLPTGIDHLEVGDLVAFGRGFDGGSPRVDQSTWESHRVRDVTVGRITALPDRTDQRIMPDELTGTAAYPWKMRFEHLGVVEAVSLVPGDQFSLAASEALRHSAINRGTGIAVPVAGSPLFEDFMPPSSHATTATAQDVLRLAHAFRVAVDDSGVRIAADDSVAFAAATLSKPFLILTGQSGSGKTQLAKRLGEWCGSDDLGRPRYLMVPVRPDWTGPEYLFGYADALQSRPGKQVWAVPDALEFILRAAAEPSAPFVLILDEMNLAHVERYFADFLSGVESREPVLPELRRVDGEWLAVGNAQRLPVPRNLIVVGTVNVDETTYLFSPKVLDRAFTFELRTRTADLETGLRRPASIASATEAEHATAISVLIDDDWQHRNPHDSADAIADDLRALHALLTPTGHEFGHRVFLESLRYAALIAACGEGDRWTAVDRIVLTKLLPKIHGTRTRVEKPLERLRSFASASDAGDLPRMPRTLQKVERMLEVLRDAQFVSFTE